MQIIEIDLYDGYPLFCPVTGHQILDKEDFSPSPAMQFCYVQGDGFEMLSEEARVVFDLAEEEMYMDYEAYHKKMDELLNNNDQKSWVIFRICSGGTLNSGVADHCIDMWYSDAR